MQSLPLKTIILDVAPENLSEDALQYRMTELESLVSTYGGITIVKKVQKKHTPDYRTFVWSGKLDEIILLGEELGAELLIIGNILKSAQVWNISEVLRKKNSRMQVWDRVDLILKIFALHASSPEAKLQIELAAIKHMGPRIYGMGMELSRQWWWSRNAKWQGETNTEIMKRHLREKEKAIREKLHIHERTRMLHRENRKKKRFLTVGIVGYTNAGKSSLFNALTKKWVLAEDKLFATLGTTVWKVWIENPHISLENAHSENRWISFLLNDTIGFIRDLPPNLIAAFTSTLEDSVESDILLHVVDASDLWIADKIQTVENILSHIGAKNPIYAVFNKCDMISPEEHTEIALRFSEKNPIFVSAETGIWLFELKNILFQRLIGD